MSRRTEIIELAKTDMAIHTEVEQHLAGWSSWQDALERTVLALSKQKRELMDEANRLHKQVSVDDPYPDKWRE